MSSRDRRQETVFDHRANQTILLYNPISGHGHLDSWNALFVEFLLQAGYRVASLGPGENELYSRLERKQLAQHPNLQILQWRAPQRSLTQRIRSRLVRQFKQVLSKGLVGQAEADKLKTLEASYLQPEEFAERVADATRQLGHKPQLVFNMYMDLYRNDLNGWRPFSESQRIPWAGIRFVPSTVPPSEAYYQLPTLKGMCFLDEQILKDYLVAVPQKCFEYLPDVTNADLPPNPSDFALEIKRRAAGRKIVFMGGTIGSNKNLSQWFKVIALANPTEWFFVQLGEVHEQNLSQDDLTSYRNAIENKPEHLLIHAEYLPDERVFNEVIALSDVLFAVYRKFSLSSNMPGKAAAFDKPLLVAQGYLMAARVNKYQLGLAVQEDDADQMLKALTDLVQPQAQRAVGRAEHFAAYRKDFSHEALKVKFYGFLDQVFASSNH
jgi:hypothetical protein